MVKINWNNVLRPELRWHAFPSRRSQVFGRKGVIATSQPLATEAGLTILGKGGNAGAKFLLNPNFKQLTS
jgi:gamma-glutamyltranspeptidase/glutathione hydrolase